MSYTPTMIIVGAGIAGLTLGIALQRRQLKFQIFEAAPQPQATGAGIFLAPNALEIFRRLGLLAEIQKHGISITKTTILREDGKLLQTIDSHSMQKRYGIAPVAIRR